MKVVIVGDSFGLPRCYKESNKIEIKYEDTYPEQLRQMLMKEFKLQDIIMINMSKRYNNSLFILQRDFEEVYLLQPEFLVIQVGVVDCWERKVGVHICKEFIGKNPWINEQEYINYMKLFILKCFQTISSLKTITVVNIAKASKEQYNKHMGSYERTNIYNKNLESLKNINKVYVCDVYNSFEKELEKVICSDGMHPSPYGQIVIAKKIFNILVMQVYFKRALESLSRNDERKAIENFRKVYDSGLKEESLYWKALERLTMLYLDKKNYKELMNILFSENINEEIHVKNINLKDLVLRVVWRVIENTDVEFKDIKEKYFIILDYLIKSDEISLFNNITSKFVKEYDCVSYENQGELMMKYGLDELATECFIKAVDLQSDNAKVYSYIAKRFEEINEFNDALDFAFKALEIDKENKVAQGIVMQIGENSER